MGDSAFRVGDTVLIVLRGETRELSMECHRTIKNVKGTVASINKVKRQCLVKFERPIPSWYRIKGLLDVPMSEDEKTTTSALWINESELRHASKEEE